MHLRHLTLGFILGSACALVGANAISQQGGNAQDQQQMDPAQQELMEKWMKVSMPGEEHAKLDYFLGDWDTSMKMWMMPGEPPSAEEGTATFEWTLDRHFMRQDFSGTLMGMPFKGTGLTGFDKYKKKWVGTWVSNTQTNIQHMEGTMDQTGKVWTYFGQMDEWMTDEHDKMVKYVVRIKNDNSFVFEVHDLTIVPGETKVIEVDYTRKK